MLLPNLPPPTEGIRHQSQNVDAYISQRLLGRGTLYIAESRLSWANEDSAEGLSLEYPHIAIHAISRDPSSFQHPCLYLMIDINIDDTTQMNGQHESDDENDKDDESEMTELRFVPEDPLILENMYKSLNDCQILHPDPEDEASDDAVGQEDDEGEFDIAEQPSNSLFEDYMGGDLERDNPPDEYHDANESDDVDMGQFDDVDRHGM